MDAEFRIRLARLRRDGCLRLAILRPYGASDTQGATENQSCQLRLI
jgi:hypothetical protein